MKPITTTNYYRLRIQNFGEYFEFGNSTTEVIATVRRDFEQTARLAGRPPRPLGGVTVRQAVYGEWKRELTHSGQQATVCQECDSRTNDWYYTNEDTRKVCAKCYGSKP